MTLKELYSFKLNVFKMLGVKDSPDRLLALLLLPEMDKYEGLMVSEGQFYDTYKQQIDEKIIKVKKDFEFSKKEIIDFIEQKDIVCDDFERQEIWFCFAEGFGVMHGALMYPKNLTSEEIYKENFCEEEMEYLLNIIDKYNKVVDPFASLVCDETVNEINIPSLAKVKNNNKQILF